MTEKRESRKIRTPFTVLFAAVLMLSVVLMGSGAITTTVSAESAASVDVELVPHYTDVTYVLDPVEMMNRFDDIGDWNLISTPVFDDSKMVMEQNEGANITVTDDANIDDGIYYECRMKANATTSAVYMELDQWGSSNDALIGLNATGKIYYTYYNGSASVTGLLGSYSANTYYRLAILFSGTSTIFYASYDNYTSIADATVTASTLEYANVDAVIIKSTAASTTCYADYMFQTGTRSSFTEASTTSSDLNTDPTLEETYTKMVIDFSDSDMKPGTYSDNASVHAVYNYTAPAAEIGTDRYFNKTDFAEYISSVKETNTEFTSNVQYQGWADLKSENEENLIAYLASNHKVSSDKVTVIDYYMDDVKLNYTWSAAMGDKIDAAWYDSVTDLSDELSATMKYDDTAGITKKASDVEYVYLDTSITEAQFEDQMEAMSDAIRKDVLSIALVIPESFGNITSRADISYAMDMSSTQLGIWYSTMENLDSAFQFTDAAIGQMLMDADYMSLDMEDMQEDSSWSVAEDGKLTASPLTVATGTGSSTVTMIVLIIIIVVIAALVILLVMMGKKRKSSAKKV